MRSLDTLERRNHDPSNHVFASHDLWSFSDAHLFSRDMMLADSSFPTPEQIDMVQPNDGQPPPQYFSVLQWVAVGKNMAYLMRRSTKTRTALHPVTEIVQRWVRSWCGAQNVLVLEVTWWNPMTFDESLRPLRAFAALNVPLISSSKNNQLRTSLAGATHSQDHLPHYRQ